MNVHSIYRVKGDEVNDLQEIYQSYANEIKAFLMCLTRNEDLAEELTQETFYQAVKSIRRYNGQCKMTVWLCQIAKHCYYDYLKKAKYRQHDSIEQLTQLGMEFDSQQALPETTFLRQQTTKEIQLEIDSLGEPYREVFLLRITLEMSFREIAQIFEKNENWARVTYYRAKCKLAERMKAYEV